jgi:L-aspartate oxidase
MKDPFVYLDLTHLKAEHVTRRFPMIHATCLRYNIDITTDLIPVRPAAHYAMGGVRTDLDGHTNIGGLYAAGEVATTGVHGANRLASNSLLEGLVYGARAGRSMRDELRSVPAKAGGLGQPVDTARADTEALVREIQDLMWANVGIVREGGGLRRAIARLEEVAPLLTHPQNRCAHEALNIHTSSVLVARSALAREESRGAHYRMDFPSSNDAKFLKHSVVSGNTIRFV